MTPWSAELGLTVPVVNAPMGGAAGGRLAAAVSRAGGLGMIGMGSSGTAALLHRELDQFDAPGAPFGIGLVHWVMTAEPGLLEVALAAAPNLLSVSFGTDWSWVATARAAGVTTVTQVSTVAAARQAADAGVDVLVARGAEGGGHGEPLIGTLPLLTEVLDVVPVPAVLAAGGVSSARGLAAVLAAGAAGAWVGTAFTACPESLTNPSARALLLTAASEQTVTTSEFDVAQGYQWPSTIPERVLLDAAGRVTPVNAGQGVGGLRHEESAAAVVERLRDGAAELLGRWGPAR